MSVSPLRILVPSPGSSKSAEIVQSSDTVLRAHLITLSDLPAGWKESTSAGTDLDASCKAISDPAFDALPLHAEADFTADSGSMPILAETLAYGGTDEVDAAWKKYVTPVSACEHLTMRLTGQTHQMVLAQTSLPRSGDASDARRALSTSGRSASVYLVLIRRGDLLESVTYAAWGTPSASDVQRLVETAAVNTAELR
ncbi:hypothetical protein [Actinospica robiniae]|uniref:hypothetical protein n=1 Tax=Actinospica robiniae TaxID=304901 RepID=UPI0012F8ACA6|nr:hypothetical protein [Actinospica robiniae]